MAAKKLSAKARAAARKQRDKWKNKRWFTIRAPRHPWNFKRIGETLGETDDHIMGCLLYTSPSPRDLTTSRMPSSA